MPFCTAAENGKEHTEINEIRRKPIISKWKNQIVTLQVRIPINRMQGCFRQDCGKKAFLSVPASMTLEAAMVLTLFLFAAVSLILPMKVLNTERRIQTGLERAGEELSKYDRKMCRHCQNST